MDTLPSRPHGLRDPITGCLAGGSLGAEALVGGAGWLWGALGGSEQPTGEVCVVVGVTDGRRR